MVDHPVFCIQKGIVYCNDGKDHFSRSACVRVFTDRCDPFDKFRSFTIVVLVGGVRAYLSPLIWNALYVLLFLNLSDGHPTVYILSFGVRLAFC